MDSRRYYRADLVIGPIPHRHADLHTRRDRLAVVEGDVRLTWAQVSERTARVANALRDRGIGRGDKVAVVLQNRAEYVEIIYALAGLGATTVPISYRFVAREIASALRHSRAKAAFVDADLVDVFAAANIDPVLIAEDLIFIVGDPSVDCGGYDDVLADSRVDRDYLQAREWDTYHLAFTGGSTGSPKACEVPQRIARQLWYDMTVEFGILDRDVTLIAGPFYHGLGFMWGLQQLMVGGTVVMQRAFEPRGFLELVQTEKVTRTAMAPTLYTMLLEVPDKDRYDVSSMRGLVSAAAPLLTRTKEDLLSYFSQAELYEYYGATEAGFYTVLKPQDQLRKVRSVGLPFAGNEIKILDPSGNEVPTGEIGIIYKRGAGLGAVYLDDPEATAAAFRDDWMTSADMGYLDDEGYLYVVDRAKDMIISGGVNIFPTEIEEVLTGHPGVAQVAVIGVPDEKWGETVRAYVVTRPGVRVDPDELTALCASALAGYKKPRSYVFLDALPVNSAGKLLKGELRARAQEGGS